MPNLAVEDLDASDLQPEDKQGSARPLEVELDEQRQRTQTKHEDLNPQWNEKLVFNMGDPRSLHNKTIHVQVYNDNKQAVRRPRSKDTHLKSVACSRLSVVIFRLGFMALMMVLVLTLAAKCWS